MYIRSAPLRSPARRRSARTTEECLDQTMIYRMALGTVSAEGCEAPMPGPTGTSMPIA